MSFVLYVSVRVRAHVIYFRWHARTCIHLCLFIIYFYNNAICQNMRTYIFCLCAPNMHESQQTELSLLTRAAFSSRNQSTSHTSTQSNRQMLANLSEPLRNLNLFTFCLFRLLSLCRSLLQEHQRRNHTGQHHNGHYDSGADYHCAVLHCV